MATAVATHAHPPTSTGLDHRKIATHAFRQSRCPGGLALRIEFNSQTEAEDFAAEFAGRMLGTPSRSLHRPHG